ncbi:MAG: cyclodeaminase/cyclohydrolase family protein [bacterium]|nr:hypothetical protein [Gammaproteobacteria bacterium]HIL95798.1 hypothetical protein [Pseudomonadales bacterium]
MKDLTIQAYLDALASKASTPGGGAVAAMTGAQAAALISMVCNLTKDKDHELKPVTNRSELARIRFIELGEADIAGFERVMNAYRLPRQSASEKATQQASLQSALLSAASAPLETLTLASSLVPDIQLLEQIGNPNLITDVGIAALLIPATIQAAQVNVLINLVSMKDENFKQNARKKIDEAMTSSQVLTRVITNITGAIAS